MQTRRQVLKEGVLLAGAFAGAGLFALDAHAFDAKVFEPHGIEATLKALDIKGEMQQSSEVALKAPDIAENGAVVPFTLSTTLPNAKKLLLLVANNPHALSASFDILPTVDAEFVVRSKMQETSDVYAVAVTDDGKAFYDKKEVKVTLGGCGG